MLGGSGRTVQPGTFARTSILVLWWPLEATPGMFAAKVLLAAGQAHTA